METKKITKTVYIANDGKEFLTEECKKHEAYVKEILRNISYFCIRCSPDLTETGYYMHRIYAAVLSKDGLFSEEIAFQWALKKFGSYLGESVMGYGFQPRFSVSEVSKEEYEECPATIWGGTPLKSEKIFLSPKSVEGFPENINYMKEWGFK